jgi:hypothetical protein
MLLPFATRTTNSSSPASFDQGTAAARLGKSKSAPILRRRRRRGSKALALIAAYQLPGR